ncbi:hypothetical protein, partial [Paenibacillus sp. JJ-223]|uniref:hypothetical protein n=1 Tax=Paenibacillus sp. JJ-223 TaxID=2905647 RepID=UPI001F2B0170
FYTSEMIENFKPSYYYYSNGPQVTSPENRGEFSTSLFILFNKETFENTGMLSYESILRTSDLRGMNEPEKKSFLLNSGLSICSQLPLYKYLISVGTIKSNQGILEWDKTFRTDNPEPGSSHVHFFKTNNTNGNIDFQEIANQFKLIDDEQTLKKPAKRKNSRRREVLVNEAKG